MQFDRLKPTSQIAASVRKFLRNKALHSDSALGAVRRQLGQNNVDEELALGRQIVTGSTEIDIDVDR